MNEELNHEDKRVRRTRQKLAAALIDLTLEQGYDTITIQDITTRASVGYRTYFRHYPDKEALLADVLRATVAELRQMMGNPAAPEANQGPYMQFLSPEGGRLLFEHIQTQSDLYRVLLAGGPVALDPIMSYGRQEASASLGPTLPGPLPPAIVANHLVTTTIDLVRWWLDNDMPYPPAEMGRYLALLTTLPGDTALAE